MDTSDAQKAAIELARWQGEMEQRLKNGESRFSRIDKTLERIEEKQDAQGEELNSMRVKIGIAAAVGSVFGGGLVTFLFAIGTKALGG